MKAIAIEGFGGVERLRLMDITPPDPGPGEVRIRIAYAGVNPVDWKIREGHLKNWMPHEFPLIPGWDASGIIESVGEGVEDFREGDEVFGYCRLPKVRFGTYCEAITVPAQYIAHKPVNLSLEQAAGIPLVALTAWQSLFDFGDLKASQSLLIQGGAGGVGSLAIQFANYIGAEVFTTARAKNHDYVKSLGAHVAIDYTQESFWEVVKKHHPPGIDMVYDCVGGKTMEESLGLVKPEGHFATIVEAIRDDFGEEHGIQARFIFVEPNGAQLKTIADLITAGAIKSPTVEALPLEKAAEAQERSKEGHTQGKLVLKIT